MSTWVEGDNCILGSQPDTVPAITIKDGTVSRRHAELFLQDGTWHVRDLDSDNGLRRFREPVDFPPSAGASIQGELIHEAAITDSLTLALGGVLVRFQAVNGNREPSP